MLRNSSALQPGRTGVHRNSGGLDRLPVFKTLLLFTLVTQPRKMKTVCSNTFRYQMVTARKWNPRTLSLRWFIETEAALSSTCSLMVGEVIKREISAALRFYLHTVSPHHFHSHPETHDPAAASWSPWSWVESRRHTHLGAAAGGGNHLSHEWTWLHTHTRWCRLLPPEQSWQPLPEGHRSSAEVYQLEYSFLDTSQQPVKKCTTSFNMLNNSTCSPALATTNGLGSPKMLLSISNSIMTVLAAS